jgi:hypothetical protein
MRMTYEQKETRKQARYYGQRCADALKFFAFHQHEANEWRRVDGMSGTLTTIWQERADQNAHDAIEYARLAARHAMKVVQS